MTSTADHLARLDDWWVETSGSPYDAPELRVRRLVGVVRGHKVIK